MKTLSVTLCFTAVLLSQYSTALTAGSVMKNQGENLTIFSGRVFVSGDPKKLTATITSLRVNESGVYSCVFIFFDVKHEEKETNGALLFVKGFTENEAVTDKVSRTETSAMPETLVLVSAITACTVVILCMLVTVVWLVPKVKALCARRREDGSKAHNAVYEDMRAHRMQQI
ncbi:hypothetical protein AOLI_G00175170 [Acnodon oligacanthus]